LHGVLPLCSALTGAAIGGAAQYPGGSPTGCVNAPRHNPALVPVTPAGPDRMRPGRKGTIDPMSDEPVPDPADQPVYGTPPPAPRPAGQGPIQDGPTRPQDTPAPYGSPPPGIPAQGSPYGSPSGSAEGSPNGSAYGTPHGSPYGTPPYGPSGGRRHRGAAGRIGAGGAAAAAAAGKAGLLAKMFLAFKGLAVLVKFKAGLSLLLSVGVYAIFWGWKFALGFVLLLFVHEIGHVVVLRAQGVPASAPMFIPFLGAFVAVKGPQRSVADEAWSAMAGPIAGTIGAVATLQLANLDGSLLLRALAYTAFLINLFNLVPALPLDGGRVAGALHPAVWGLGILAAVGLLIYRPSPVLIFVLLLGGMEAYRRWNQRRAGQAGEYYSVPPAMRAALGVTYVAIAVACLYGMHVAHVANPA